MTPKRILVCDDEPHILNVVASKLRNAGFEVLTARDGQEGLQVAGRERPDLIVTDYQMPCLSGLEMCAKLRENPSTILTPVVMLTARGYSLSDDTLAQTNIRKVLVKPFSPREVLATVQELLALQRQEAAIA
jgi:two-component system alkaline phosphatase synthesis response regulator PhoP